jgi:HupE / UreJ protein
MRALVVIVVMASVASVDAHGLRTAYLEINEVEPGHAVVHLRLGAPDPALAVGSDCTLEPATEPGELFDRTWLLDCAGGFASHSLTVTGLGPITSEAVAWIGFFGGGTTTQLVRGDATTIALRPVTPSTLDVAHEFVGLGLVHILTGYDHLLFLLLLVLLLRDVRSVLLAETAFTISHALSFSATALGWIHVSAAAAETCIALSLVLLAADVELRGPAPARWRGAAMALVFGFVHGLGFAGGLREIGLPEHEIGAALLGFAGGIELGQVAFLAIVLAILHTVRNVPIVPRIKLVGLYAIGGVSAYWVLARGLACLWSA